MTTVTRTILAASVLTIFVGAYGCGLFGDGWEAPTVVKISGNAGALALTPSWLTWAVVSEADSPQAVLLRDGDLLTVMKDNNGGTYVRYRASDGPSLALTATDWSVKIGDKVVCVLLDEDGTAWLNAATPQQLADVRTLHITDQFGEAALAAVKRLASANTNLDLLMGANDSLARALTFVHPRALFAEAPIGSVLLDALANQPQIEMLLIDASQPDAFAALPKLPKLHTLVLGDWDVEKTGPLPAGLSNLKTLIVVGPSGLRDLKAVAATATGLETFTLSTLKQPTSLAGIEQMTGLRTLILNSDKIQNLESLAGLKDLRWIGLPTETSQAQFAAFVSAHPKLVVLDMIGNKSVKDLAPVGTLKNLQGVVLDGPYNSLSPIQTLTTLRFVGISKKTWEADPGAAEAVRKALPDALVVKVEPFCLGSGWILLIVPVSIAAWWIRRRRSTSLNLAA